MIAFFKKIIEDHAAVGRETHVKCLPMDTIAIRESELRAAPVFLGRSKASPLLRFPFWFYEPKFYGPKSYGRIVLFIKRENSLQYNS